MEPTPEQLAARETERLQREAEIALERAEHERVERVLRAVLGREAVAHDVSPPKDYGQVDKRWTGYTLAAPLPMTAADLAALNGPLTRFETATDGDGRVSLTTLSARDRTGGGVEVRVAGA